MSTNSVNTVDCYQISTQLNQLIFGDRNLFIFIPDKSDAQIVETARVTKFLHKLDKKGYAIANAHIMLNWTIDVFNQFKEQLLTLLKANTKEGLILRKAFAEGEQLQDYSEQDWLVILAQYSITYSWSDHYADFFGQSAEKILSEYVNSMNDKTFIQKGKTRIFNIAGENELSLILRNIVESPVILRTQQIKILEQAPADALAKVCSHARISLKETLIKVMTLLADQNLDKPILKSATDVIRYVLASSVEQPYEGQITKDVLKKAKHRIPTRIRKALLNNMECIANNHKSGVKFLTEDMLTYENYWKRLDKHLRFTKSKIMRKRYQNYTQAIDLLYAGDRSWTYNGRIAAAKAIFDYDAAIRVMAERPGFLLRNMVEFLRMTKGTSLPVKKQINGAKKTVNAFLNALMNKSTPIDSNVIITDASDFLKSDDFVKLISTNINIKLAWQLVEQLKDKSLQEAVYKREVQGQYIEYIRPIPGVDPELTKAVCQQLLKAIKKQLRARNENLGKCYIDDDSKAYRLQYSGRKSTEISFAGEFLSPGTEVSLSDYLSDGKTDIKDPLIRLGVMWRSRPDKSISIDIDHNVKLSNGTDVYYGSPVYKAGSKVLVTSSGDITSCGDHNSAFSVELIDADPVALSENDIKSLYSSMINFSGRVPIGSLECYLFFTLIDRKHRVMGDKTRMAIDLSRLDYAIQVDANQSDNTGSYIGIEIDLENDKIKALCLPVKNKGRYTNVKVNNRLFNQTLANMPEHLTIDYALRKALSKQQITNDPYEADLLISRRSLETIFGVDKLGVDKLEQVKSKTLFHPGRDAEKINQLLF